MARRRKLDMSKVEARTRCSEGVHTAKIVEVQENTTQAGDDMLTMAFEVIKGDSKGAKVYDNFVLTDKALWKLKQLLQAIGVKCDGKIILDLDKLIGKVCDILVYHEEYNGKTKARIDEYTPIKRQTEDDEDEDELEDEDDTEEEEPEEKPAKKAAKPAPKKKPEPKEEEEDEDWDEDEEEPEEEEKPKKKAKPEPKKKAPVKAKKKPDPEPEEDDWDDDDEDWDE